VAGTALGGIVTYPVEVLIANPSPRLKMGMTASVAIEVERIPDTLIVNALALYDVQDTSAKLLVIERDGTQREVTVTVLASNDSEAAIRGNIAEGATVSLNAGRSASASTSAGISLAATVG
jgi:multidrug efflux pump subunit AcrA (membrane-fusion protein)